MRRATIEPWEPADNSLERAFDLGYEEDEDDSPHEYVTEDELRDIAEHEILGGACVESCQRMRG
jgi:hypothetical protein